MIGDWWLEKFNQKKLLENLVIFLIIAVIVMIVINSLYGSSEKPKNQSDLSYYSTYDNAPVVLEKDSKLDEKMAHILSQISGAGKVDVMISYKNEVQKIPMTDAKTTITITNEKDSNGGERKTEQTSTEETVIYDQLGTNKSPVVKETILPEIVGVIVVADGANNASVRENLTKAVEAIVEVPSHRIQVFAR
mgnify:CR=1 FL=1